MNREPTSWPEVWTFSHPGSPVKTAGLRKDKAVKLFPLLHWCGQACGRQIPQQPPLPPTASSLADAYQPAKLEFSELLLQEYLDISTAFMSDYTLQSDIASYLLLFLVIISIVLQKHKPESNYVDLGFITSSKAIRWQKLIGLDREHIKMCAQPHTH